MDAPIVWMLLVVGHIAALFVLAIPLGMPASLCGVLAVAACELAFWKRQAVVGRCEEWLLQIRELVKQRPVNSAAMKWGRKVGVFAVVAISVGLLGYLVASIFALGKTASREFDGMSIDTSAISGLVCVAVVGLFSFVFYFLPTFVAILRDHHNATAIGVLNFFLGWTFLGWVIALVWSFTDPAP